MIQNGAERLAPAEVAASLGETWVDGAGPLYEKLARSLQRAIDDGHLAGGTYLPSERRLAETLFVSRSTVVAAYRSLRDQGTLVSRRGSGTWISGRSVGSYSDEETLSILARDPYLSGVIDTSSAPIDLTLPAPRAALERITAVLARDSTWTDLLTEASPLGYQPRGLRSFRRLLARRLEQRGLPTSEDELLVTNGGQQAIALLVNLFLRQNDRIIVENPSYRGLIDALIFSHAGVAPVPIESTRLPARIHDYGREARPRLIYLTPTCHNPTGVTLDAETRREIVRVAARLEIPIVEDTVLADLSLDDPPLPLAAYASKPGAVILVGSLSKVLWGGLRVGWIRATSELISRLARLKAVADMGTSAVSQLIALELMHGHIDDVIALQRREIEESLELTTTILGEQTHDWQWRRPAGGRSLWIRLPRGDGSGFAQFALLHGVAISAGETLSFDSEYEDHIRVQFVQPKAKLQEGLQRLGDAWQAYAASL